MIDVDNIKDIGNGCFEVPSSINPQTEVRIVDMKAGKCNCIIVRESRIICRHIWRVIDKYAASHGYSIDDVDTEWFISIHEVDPTYGTSETSQSSNSENDNSTVSKQKELDIDMNEKKDENEHFELPVPVSESKRNLHSAQGILSQIKTLQSLVYSLKHRSDLYMDFRQSGDADNISTKLNEMINALMNRFPNDEDIPITGMEETKKTRITKKEALNREEECADIPFIRSKGRPTASQTQSNLSVNSNSNDSTKPRRSERLSNKSQNK